MEVGTQKWVNGPTPSLGRQVDTALLPGAAPAPEGKATRQTPVRQPHAGASHLWQVDPPLRASEKVLAFPQASRPLSSLRTHSATTSVWPPESPGPTSAVNSKFLTKWCRCRHVTGQAVNTEVACTSHWPSLPEGVHVPACLLLTISQPLRAAQETLPL